MGPVIARADHWGEAIEVNRDIFYQLPPNVQEFVLCHEVCHLKHNEWDEARTNELASQLYLSRAASPAERKEREEFLSYLAGNGGYNNFPWTILISAIPAAVKTGFTVYGFIKDQNAGWYSWDDATKRANLKVMLSWAFEQARKSGSKSAADYFWEQLYKYDNKDNDVDEFLKRSQNAWVKPIIEKYEQAYGFQFEAVTPIDITAYPLALAAIGILGGVLLYTVIKKLR